MDASRADAAGNLAGRSHPTPARPWEVVMLKRVLLPVLAAATMTIAAMSVANAVANWNGISLNGANPNGLALNGWSLNGSGPGGNVAFDTALQAVRLILPGGVELTFR